MSRGSLARTASGMPTMLTRPSDTPAVDRRVVARSVHGAPGEDGDRSRLSPDDRMDGMSGLLAALYGLSGAIVYGAADFFGGLSSRRLGALRTAGIAAVAGLAILLLAVPFLGAHWSADALLYGALSGVAGAIALSL